MTMVSPPAGNSVVGDTAVMVGASYEMVIPAPELAEDRVATVTCS
jgi:hypothetical protein